MSDKVIVTTCPHCLTERIAFYFQSQTKKPNSDCYTLFFYCGNCFKGVCVTSQYGITDRNAGNYNHFIREIYPEPKKPEAPKHTPENVAKHLVAAKFNLNAGQYETAAQAARTAIEVACNNIGASGKTLFNKIDNLKANHSITPDLAKWAHQVRIIGKTAAHDLDDIAKIDAEDAVAFAEMFSMYLFMLPGMLKERAKDIPDDVA